MTITDFIEDHPFISTFLFSVIGFSLVMIVMYFAIPNSPVPKPNTVKSELVPKGGYVVSKIQVFPYKEQGQPEINIWYIGIKIPNCKDILMLKVTPAVWAKIEEDQPVILNFTDDGIYLDDYSFELTPKHQEQLPDKKSKALQIRKVTNV